MVPYDIRARAQECYEQFQLLLRIKEEIGIADEAEDTSQDNLWVKDQFARFKMWAGNIGAFADGHASLDYRLRDSDETKQFLLDFLASLVDFIRTGKSESTTCPILRDLEALLYPLNLAYWYIAIDTSRPFEGAERTDSPLEENILDDTASFGTSISSTVSSSFQGTETDSLQDDSFSTTTFERTLQQKRLQGIEKAIDRLYRLSLIIRQPSRESQNERAGCLTLTDEEGNNIDASFAKYASDIISHRFPSAPSFLRRKLAYGIVIRRKRFMYRQRHQRKLSATSFQDNDVKGRKVDVDKTEKMDSTVRDIRSTELKPMGEVLPIRGRTHSDATASKTSASAIPKEPLPLKSALEESQSNQSTAFTMMNSMSAAVDIPRPPKPMSGGKEFECPYCCLFLPIKLTRAGPWR